MVHPTHYHILHWITHMIQVWSTCNYLYYYRLKYRNEMQYNIMKRSMFSDIKLCSPLKVDRHFKERPVDGINMFLWHIPSLKTDYITHPRRHNSLQPSLWELQILQPCITVVFPDGHEAHNTKLSINNRKDGCLYIFLFTQQDCSTPF
jgi:hypothetical protein